MPTAPPRRFAPTPVETTSRSSKQKDTLSKDDPAPRRRFLPEPVETIGRSSKENRSPETGDLHVLKKEHNVRRFAPEPVESTKRSSRDKKEQNAAKDKPKPRRFAPEPVEHSRKSSKDKKEESHHIKFKPELIETAQMSSTDRKPVRKFAPVLIETAKRSRKAGVATGERDRTEQGHGLAAREHRRHITGVTTPMEIDSHMPLDLDALNDHAQLRPISPFDGSRRQRSQQRQHSFRCPDLDTIESSESDRESDTSSIVEPVQGSPITASDSSFNEYKHATRARESVDENFSKYFLELEAKRAEKRLREQALAAFPNSDFHEPVQHYMDVEKDSDSDESIDYRPTTYDAEDEEYAPARKLKRDSTGGNWEQQEMQRHAEQLDQERKANQITAKKQSNGPWWSPDYDMAAPVDRELRSMRDRARPPMLGGDIDFPRCRSPEPTRFDVTQGAAALRNQMYAESQAPQSKRPSLESGLWNAPSAKCDVVMSGTSSTSSSGSAAGGLWGGFCTDSSKKKAGGLEAPILPSGLVTPRSESMNLFDQSFALPHCIEMSGVAVQTPPTPEDMPHMKGSHTINNILITQHELEQTLETEYPDSFVTQVYNYLSLGYPSLARPFDEELAKISHIPVSDLRVDDEKARNSPRGYIRLGPDFEGGGGVEREESCIRWIALKRYVHEWARQEKNMSKLDGPGASFAVAARRGSWGN